ncbi:MAG: DMT family transporter [Acidimicrobiales bacterium]|nr:DMT family transporter [Acidimicrobiales bacterium]MDG2219234.1 DMT family transporter [Acidimicrobiales bacterium]
MRIDRRKGWGLAALGMLLVSTDSYFIRLSELNGWNVAFLVGCLSLPVQLVAQRVVDGGKPLAAFRQYRSGLLIVGVLSGVSQISFITAVTKTNVSNVVVIVAAAPVIAAIVGRIMLGERTSRQVWLAILITIAGVVIVVSGSVGAPNLVGDFLALVAIVAFAINMNVWRRYSDMSRFVGLALAAMISIAITVWFIDNPFGHDQRAYFSVACMGLLFNPMGRIAHTNAPRFAPAAEIALFVPVETLAATAWAWIAFSEKPVVTTFIGGGIVIFGMIVGTYGRARGPGDLGCETVSRNEVTQGKEPA